MADSSPAATPERIAALNIAIAKWMGITACKEWRALCVGWQLLGTCGHASCMPVEECPNYCGSLDAIASVEAKLDELERVAYMNHLVFAVGLTGYPVGLGEVFVMVSAAAMQRATALAQALNLEVEG